MNMNTVAGEAFVDYYEVLRVDTGGNDASDASAEAIRKAWMKRAMETHPDKGGAGATQEAFLLVQKAWNVLGDEVKRRTYDDERRMLLCNQRRLCGGGGESADACEGVRAIDCEIDLDDMETQFDESSSVYVFKKRCRCGAFVSVDENQLDEHSEGAGTRAGYYHICCPTCSLVTVVAYAHAPACDDGS